MFNTPLYALEIYAEYTRASQRENVLEGRVFLKAQYICVNFWTGHIDSIRRCEASYS